MAEEVEKDCSAVVVGVTMTNVETMEEVYSVLDVEGTVDNCCIVDSCTCYCWTSYLWSEVPPMVKNALYSYHY